MKKLTKAFMSLSLVVILMVATNTNVAAHTNEVSQANAPDESVLQTTSQSDDPTGLEGRNLQRLTQATERIDAAILQRVATRCASAQDLIQAAITRSTAIKTNRTTLYNKISAKLNSIVTRLAAAEIESSQLQGHATELSAKTDAFFADLELYHTALDDAAAIDCVEDTEGFLLALEEARSLHEQLKTAAEEIKLYVRDTVIGTLNSIRSTLPASTDANEEAQ